MKRKGRAHIGTSGWHYKHWAGTFYPADIKSEEQLSYYIRHFPTVEINNSFYRLLAPAVFRTWKESVPPQFIFAVKASRYITHMKKLKLDSAGLRKFFNSIKVLGDKLGPVLFQLPPGWKVNAERLASFLKALPPGYRYAFEFRNPTWYTDEVYELLSAHNCAFCIYELASHVSPLQRTADFVYLRLHGPGAKYEGSYTVRALQAWAKRIRAWREESLDVYVYFDNDQAGYAAHNAMKLSEIITQ